ncbi:leukemia NUP98 fusion partner 1-like isoform X2 [Erpetoichthys calabaricus]|uniref:leukemia NUP98 fusion partner 1-like isoform X2 n=1 Tax=Erpetoichthys calabaricus TaxID=27687 RepID=UPI002234358D|nr:leukemia NUP98 fusion partner 1-like isoform X2 [Erpetoichthys calabaricus]
MDHDEDEDVNFAKWMSSFWGHSLSEDTDKDRRTSRKRQSRSFCERRASLPCPAQLSVMNLNRRHSASTSASSVYLRGYKEGGEDKEARCHMRARRSSSSEESHHKASIPENRVSTIHKLTESFEKKLHFRTRKTVSLEEDEDPCVICHDGLNAGRVQELHCMHKFHKEEDIHQAGPSVSTV